jgi:hypothetical protein
MPKRRTPTTNAPNENRPEITAEEFVRRLLTERPHDVHAVIQDGYYYDLQKRNTEKKGASLHG